MHHWLSDIVDSAKTWLPPAVAVVAVWLFSIVRRGRASKSKGFEDRLVGLARRRPAPSPPPASAEPPPDTLPEPSVKAKPPPPSPSSAASAPAPAPSEYVPRAKTVSGNDIEVASNVFFAPPPGMSAAEAARQARERADQWMKADQDEAVGRSAATSAADTGYQTVRVFVGTDRRREDTGSTRFGGHRAGALALCAADITVPRNREGGRIQRPRRILSFTIEREDPRLHFTIAEVTEYTSDEAFIDGVNRENAKAPDGVGLLFIHGFNTSFDGGLYRSAQLAADLDVDGVIFHYSWPSMAKLLMYDYDAESVRQSRKHFLKFLNVIFRSGVKRVNVLAHSKGNDLLLEALNSREMVRRAQIGQVVLAAPDVDGDVARELILGSLGQADGITLYASNADLALRTSNRKVGGPPRAGELMEDGFPLIVRGIDSIDATSGKMRLDEFNHNTFVADTVLRFDLARLLETGLRPPNKRSPSITPRQCDRGDYWLLEQR